MPPETATTEHEDAHIIKLDLEVMSFVRNRLNLADYGRINVQIARAAAARRPSELQRLLLSLVEHKEPDYG